MKKNQSKAKLPLCLSTMPQRHMKGMKFVPCILHFRTWQKWVVSLMLYPKRRPILLIRQKTCWAPEMCQKRPFLSQPGVQHSHPYCSQPLYWAITTCIKANQNTKKEELISTTTKIFPAKFTLWIMCTSNSQYKKYGEI